jgi:hypothetical protein
MPFDPDAYLKKKPEQTTNPFKTEGFDPDAYLKQTPKPFDPDAYLGAKPAAPTQPSAPPEEKSSLWEFPKALVRGAYDLKGMYAGLQQRGAALGIETPQAAMDVFNKIDAGEIKSKADISKLVGGDRRLPTAEEMVEGDSRLGAKVRTFNLARDYLNATPEERKALRAQMQGDIQQGTKDLASAVALGEQVKKEAAPYEARVKSGTEVISNLFDIKNFNDAVNFVTDAGSYLASTSGQAIPQMVPMIGAAVLTRGRAAAPAAVGAGMELGAGTQNRVDFISDKIKDEADPNKRIEKIGKYIQDTSDVTVTAAIMNGALDAVLGPEKDIAKAIAAQSLKDLTRKEIAKQIPKAVAKSGAQEFFTGGMQEVVQINAERKLGEQTGDAFTKDNIKRVVDSAMAEAIGGATVTTGFEAARVATAKKDISETPEGRALSELDRLAAEEEAALEPEAPRRPADLTPQEISNIERRLYAELGREPNEYEFEEAINDYLDEQTTGRAVESRAAIAGVPSTGAPEAAGVPDTTVPTTPESGRLDTTGGAAEVAGVGEGAKPGALEAPTGEKRNVATYLEGLPQDVKRYNTYINNPEVGPLLQSANAAIQKLTDFINSRGFSVREVNRATPDQEVQRAKDLSSEVSGIAARLLLKQDAVDRNLKRASPEQLQQAKAELQDFISSAVDTFLPSPTVEEPANILEEQYRSLPTEELVAIYDDVLGDPNEYQAAKVELDRRGEYTPIRIAELEQTLKNPNIDTERRAQFQSELDQLTKVAEPKVEGRLEEVTTLNDNIQQAVVNKLSGLLVGDEVKFGNTPGVVIGLEGDYAKFHPVNATNPKAYTRIPKNQLTFISRPNVNFTSSATKEPTKFGEESAILDVDKARITKTLGANMYAANIADVAVKELLQNSFDSIKAAVHFGEIKEGKIEIKVNSRKRTITIKDNGQGMSPEIVKKAFFTIGGSNKAGVPMSLQSGGFGMAKLGFIMGSESIQLDTVKDGVRTRVDATSEEIGNDNFKLVKSPASKSDHGTTITVKIPETYADSRTGEDKMIYFPYSVSSVDVLGQPLIGPVEVKTDFDGDKRTLAMGTKFDFKATPKLTTVKFPWGSADVYFGVERKSDKYDIQHKILSSGVYQFNYREFNLGQNEKIPYDIIVDVKSDVPATDREYPFEKNRESFNKVIKEDIDSLTTYLAQVARGHEAEGLQETFKDIVTMPRTEVGTETAEASAKLKKVFDQRGATEKGTFELPPMPKEIVIGGGIVKDIKGTVLVDKEKTDDRKRKSGFEAEKAAPQISQFLVDMKQDPRQPIFHNNTNADLLEIGRKYGNPEQFFAELGTLVVEMKEELSKSGIWTYDQLSPENLFFAGISVDKGYGGVFIKVPFKGVLLNPFYDWGAKTLFGVRQNYINTMIHEIAHQTTGEHDRSHENAMLKIEQYLADTGMLDYFRDAVLDILVKHESTFTAMREAYGRSTTKNVAKSLEDYGKSPTTAEVGRDEGRRADTTGELSKRKESLRDRDLRPDSEEIGKSEIGRRGPKFSVEEFKKKPGETEDAYVDRVSRGTSAEMPTGIVDMLRNNDLNGALRAVANTLPGFYGTLANRLAALDMPTGVRIGDQRNLARRRIDYVSGDQQKRLFDYLRTAAPDFYNKYFNQYDRAENLEAVYAGLIALPNSIPATKLGPVRTEYDTVLQTFEDDMPGLTALGGYYPTFDEINLNDSVRAYGTGMRRESGLSYRTFLHESVHAATEMLLLTPADRRTAEQNAAIDELERLYRYALGKIKGDRYGFTNLSEFIAEVMTSQKFQNELKAIPYAPTKGNIFTRFVQAVMKLVGLDNVAGRAMVEAEKLFTPARPYQILSAGPRFAQAPKKRRVRGPISQPDTYRTAETQQNTLNQTLKDAYEGRMSWADAIKVLGPSMWDAGNTVLRKTTLPVLNLTQLEDLTRTKFTQITGALKIIRDMVAYRAKKMNVASEIMRDWTKAQKKNFAQSQLMGRIMMEATIRGIDPDTAPAGALNKPLQDAWNTLQPEFKTIYRRVRDFYANSVNEMVREAKRRASAIQDPAARAKALQKIDEQFGPDKLVKPYFPLRRFGQYWYQVGSGNFKEFYEFENPLSRDLAMRRRAQELGKGNKQQRDLVRTMTKGNGISELYGRNLSTTQALKDVEELVNNISATDVADLKDQLKDSLNQLIYILLPQQSVRKMFINRKAIQGASADMLRVFATTAVHSAYQQSRFMYSEKFLQNLNNARSEIDDAQKTGMLSTDTAAMYRDFIFEVEQRVPTIMSNEDTSMTAQVAGKASELTFYYMLSAPFTALLNTIGAVQLAMPYIGGSYGYVRANALLTKNMGRYLATSPTRTFVPLAKGSFAQVNFPSIVEGGKLPPLLQKAADRFIDDGLIDISLTNDIFELGERPSALYTGTAATVKKVMSGLFHQSERMNREIVLLTTFELAHEKFLKDYQRQPGMEGLRGVYLRDAQGNKIKNTPEQAFDLAIEEATRVASTSLGDYSRQTKGRIFANPIMNLLLKFKQYPILAMYSILRNFHVGVVAPFKEAEINQYRELLEQELKNDPNKDKIIAQRLQEVEAQRKALEKEGRRRLAGILGVTTILGGIAASPFFSLVVGNLVKMFADDDDDEYFDWENWFYNYMEGEFGGYLGGMLANAGIEPKTAEKVGRKTAEAVSRGLPAAMGAAVADRVSLDPKALLWRDGRYSPDARENFIESLIANAGPVVGLGLNFVDAYQLAKEGQYARAVEKAVPAIIAKPASAVRMAGEGATTKKGDVLIDDFTATELAMQSIGLQPERLAQKQKAAISIKQKEQKILDAREAIMDRLWMERDNPDGYEAAIERALEFNSKRKDPKMHITPKRISESFKKRAQLKAEAEALGAKYDKRLRSELMGMGEFADDE